MRGWFFRWLETVVRSEVLLNSRKNFHSEFIYMTWRLVGIAFNYKMMKSCVIQLACSQMTCEADKREVSLIYIYTYINWTNNV